MSSLFPYSLSHISLVQDLPPELLRLFCMELIVGRVGRGDVGFDEVLILGGDRVGSNGVLIMWSCDGDA